jgi:excisionase family DNA binding protein
VKLAYTVNEACEAIGIGRTALYGYLGSGALKAFKLGKRTLIDADELRGFVIRAQQDN